MPRVTVIARRRKGKYHGYSACPPPGTGRRLRSGRGDHSAVTEYLLPATMRGVAVQAVAALGVLTGLWIALSPSFVTLQHGGGNSAVANLIAGLAVAAVGARARWPVRAASPGCSSPARCRACG